jgi:uncharacterized protein
MIRIRVLNRTRASVLGDRVLLADDLWSRSRGFLFRPPPAAGEGILLSPCRAVHMYSVRFPLDVVFISETGQVVATYRDLRPWRRSRVHGSALHALELPAGTIRATNTAVGDLLSWEALDNEAVALEADKPGASASAWAESPDADEAPVTASPPVSPSEPEELSPVRKQA